MERTCANCGLKFENGDEFVELQPCGVASDGELYRENMAWFVHTGVCLSNFIDETPQL